MKGKRGRRGGTDTSADGRAKPSPDVSKGAPRDPGRSALRYDVRGSRKAEEERKPIDFTSVAAAKWIWIKTKIFTDVLCALPRKRDLVPTHEYPHFGGSGTVPSR